MKGNYAPDTFTESDVLRALESANLRYKNGQRYILSQCPLHNDKNPSVQIYKDDWFVNCHAGCGRFHVTKAFPFLRDRPSSSGVSVRPVQRARSKPVVEHQYKAVDLMEFWEKLSEIPEDHFFKSIPIDVLHDLGWRYDPNGHRYFIPYFSASRTSIPFAQWRNLADGPRFNFWKDAKPTCYGTWNLDNSKLFVVEGASDAAVLEYAAVPWIAMPSAASVELMRQMAHYCKENGIQLVYAGDNDAAGDKLRDALDEVAPYRVKQARKPYKDWGEMLEAEGVESVMEYCGPELGYHASITPELPPNDNLSRETNLKNIQKHWPEARELELVADPKEISKELKTVGPTSVLF